MSKRKLDDPAQFNFFRDAEPDLTEAEVVELLNRAITRSHLSRPQIAERMGTTKPALDAFTAKSKTAYRFPYSFVVRFCRATGDKELVYRLCDALGIAYHRDPAEAMYAELGRLQVELDERGARAEDLERRLYKGLK